MYDVASHAMVIVLNICLPFSAVKNVVLYYVHDVTVSVLKELLVQIPYEAELASKPVWMLLR